MKAIILAAGRGSRLGPLTGETPKCLVKLSNIPLLHWQLAAMSDAGIDNVTVVTGYQKRLIELESQTYDFLVRFNPQWESTNMVASMWSVNDLLEETCIVSYSDIIYDSKTITNLIESSASLGVAYDESWLDLWSARFENPLDDAESFEITDRGIITEIGKKITNLKDIQGQFLGVMRFTKESKRWISELIKEDKVDLSNLDMTSLISLLITKGHSIKGVKVIEPWCEIDSRSDLKVAEKMIAEGRIQRPTISRIV